ncbi:unnamed protein product [Lampetra planeri]
MSRPASHDGRCVTRRHTNNPLRRESLSLSRSVPQEILSLQSGQGRCRAARRHSWVVPCVTLRAVRTIPWASRNKGRPGLLAVALAVRDASRGRVALSSAPPSNAAALRGTGRPHRAERAAWRPTLHHKRSPLLALHVRRAVPWRPSRLPAGRLHAARGTATPPHGDDRSLDRTDHMQRRGRGHSGGGGHGGSDGTAWDGAVAWSPDEEVGEEVERELLELLVPQLEPYSRQRLRCLAWALQRHAEARDGVLTSDVLTSCLQECQLALSERAVRMLAERFSLAGPRGHGDQAIRGGEPRGGGWCDETAWRRETRRGEGRGASVDLEASGGGRLVAAGEEGRGADEEWDGVGQPRRGGGGSTELGGPAGARCPKRRGPGKSWTCGGRATPGARRAQQQERREHHGVCVRAQLGARCGNRGQTGLQDQGPASQDEHVHQDAGAGRGARVRHHRPPRGRVHGQAGDPLGRRTLLRAPGLPQQAARPGARPGAQPAIPGHGGWGGRCRGGGGRRCAAPTSAGRAGPDDDPGARAVPRRGPRGGAQGRHDPPHPAGDAHLHRDAEPRARARLRGDGPAAQRGARPRGDRVAHRRAHRQPPRVLWRRRRRRRRERLPRQRHGRRLRVRRRRRRRRRLERANPIAAALGGLPHHPGRERAASASGCGSSSSSAAPSASSASGGAEHHPSARRQGQLRECAVCRESAVTAALVPCGHKLFCMECASGICHENDPKCPVCLTSVTQAIRIFS